MQKYQNGQFQFSLTRIKVQVIQIMQNQETSQEIVFHLYFNPKNYLNFRVKQEKTNNLLFLFNRHHQKRLYRVQKSSLEFKRRPFSEKRDNFGKRGAKRLMDIDGYQSP